VSFDDDIIVWRNWTKMNCIQNYLTATTTTTTATPTATTTASAARGNRNSDFSGNKFLKKVLP